MADINFKFPEKDKKEIEEKIKQIKAQQDQEEEI